MIDTKTNKHRLSDLVFAFNTRFTFFADISNVRVEWTTGYFPKLVSKQNLYSFPYIFWFHFVGCGCRWECLFVRGCVIDALIKHIIPNIEKLSANPQNSGFVVGIDGFSAGKHEKSIVLSANRIYDVCDFEIRK